jgi:hypothetical protein
VSEVEDGRTAAQWLRAAAAYCHFMSGADWRRLSNSQQRNDSTYLYYLGGKRLLLTALYAEDEPGIHVVLPSLSPVPPKLPGEVALLALPRPVLVRQLMAENSALTSRRILSALSRQKLAHMLADTRENARRHQADIA